MLCVVVWRRLAVKMFEPLCMMWRVFCDTVSEREGEREREADWGWLFCTYAIAVLVQRHSISVCVCVPLLMLDAIINLSVH